MITLIFVIFIAAIGQLTIVLYSTDLLQYSAISLYEFLILTNFQYILTLNLIELLILQV